MAYFLDQSILTGGTRKSDTGIRQGHDSGTAPSRGGRTNRFPAACSLCGCNVPKGMGSLENRNGAWITTHLEKCA